ncbi:hypothetical protein RD792_009792 [Penstemon davidsonii]|uniref:Uncharacterized protein n=1 Tax=Penstemon davidsonii TaxID=160366 RepID=A0ABR0D030_9LAMI|nr:hypothetical protein RD792_009792 [Penstemon davidsonii]
MMQHKRSAISFEQKAGFRDLMMPKRLKTDVPLSNKTDTASVLSEAMEYIIFLHEQVKVLSAPYLCSTPTTVQTEESEQSRLRGKGLCLVPVALTGGVTTSSNGADIWAPIKTNNPPCQFYN